MKNKLLKQMCGSSFKLRKKGFTLIELLVVIAIIGLLASIIVVSVDAARKKARDSVRLHNMSQVAKALELYHFDNGVYPVETDYCCMEAGSGETCECDNVTTAINSYLPTIPSDSLYDSTAPCNDEKYGLQYKSEDGSEFTLFTRMESGEDAKRFAISTGSDGKGGNIAYTDTSGLGLETCPENYVLVPGNATYGTSDFCVMKYEASNNGDGVAVSDTATTPWVSITQTAAITACSNIGDGYHLITNDEWMTIARNAEQVDANWTGGVVGSGVLKRGNVGNTETGNYDGNNPEYGTDRNVLAELTLSNGETIWDLSGNVWEWTNDTLFESDTASSGNGNDSDGITGGEMPKRSVLTDSRGWYELTSLNAYGKYIEDEIRPSDDTWDSTKGMGKIYLTPGYAYDGSSYSSSTHAFLRGGRWGDGANAGAFTLNLNDAPSNSNSSIGFRCAR